jgi:hypothetical protein
MVRLSLLRNGDRHGVVPYARPESPTSSHCRNTPPLCPLLPSTTVLARGPALLRRWEKGSSPKKTHLTIVDPPHLTRLSRRRQHHLFASVPVPTPKLRYLKHTSIAWLLLRHRFLAAYSDHVNYPDPVPSALHSTSNHHNLDTISILQLIDTISINIDRDLSDFHRAHHRLSATFCCSNPDNDETITPLELHLVSVSEVLIGDIHNLQITALLRDDDIARLEYALFGNADYDAGFALANMITPSNISGQFTHPYHMPSPTSSTPPLYLRGGLAIRDYPPFPTLVATRSTTR